MFQYLVLQYHFKGNKNELELLKYLTHIAKNVYNNSVYLIKREYLKNGRLPLYRNIEDELVNSDFKRLHIRTAYELYTRAYNAFKNIINENRYKNKELELPKFLPKYAFTTIILKDVRFDLVNLKVTIPINREELLKGKLDPDLREYIEGLSEDFVTFKIPDSFKGKIKKPIHLKIHPSKDGRIYSFYILHALFKPTIKKDNGRILAMDLGVDNLASCVDTSFNSFIIDGRYLKSILHLYNKRIADFQSKLPLSEKGKPIGTSKRIERMFMNRKNKVTDYLDKSVAKIVNYTIENNIRTVVIGWNKGLTNGGVKLSMEATAKLKSKINQSFMGIPFEVFREKIKTRCTMKGINCIEIDESYTSAKSFYDNDDINNRYETPSGKRIERGLYKTKDGKTINADINAALNILRRYLLKNGSYLEAPDRIITPYRVYIYKKD